MKIVIKERQHKLLIDSIESFLKEKLINKSEIFCDIKVYEVNQEETDFKVERGLKYDIRIFISMSIVKVYNPTGLYGLKKGMESKIRKYLDNIFGLEENEYFLAFGIKDCKK